MRCLRLLADDLTGALDSAARFVPVTGPVAVTWQHVAPEGSVAIDSGTRDLPAEAARQRIERFVPLLDGGEPAFKKIDSLLRGHVALELAACMRRFEIRELKNSPTVIWVKSRRRRDLEFIAAVSVLLRHKLPQV